MQYDTAGNPIIFYDQCACCNIDTGGNHQHWCPCNPESIIHKLTEQGFEDIRQGRYKPLIEEE